MAPPAGLAALQDLGFTEIEALVYAALLQESPATGYRVSHRIGRPTPNTYKAIASLQAKGAVLVDDGGNRLCRAVAPDEVLAALERRFQASKARAQTAIESLVPLAGDDRVYQLQSVDQVLERARVMLKNARKLVLLDVFPGPFAALRDALVAAARRVHVVAKVYDADADANGVDLVVCADPERVRALWPGQHLTLVRDAEEHLLALLAEDLTSVHQAVWSSSTFLSCMHHNHVASELAITDHAAGGRLDAERVRLTSSGVSGLRTLRARFAPRTRTKQTKR